MYLDSEERGAPVEASVVEPLCTKVSGTRESTLIYKHKVRVTPGALGKYSSSQSTLKTIAQNYNVKT